MLPTLTYLSLALALFQCLIFCDAQFIRPPEIDEDRKSDADLGKNARYNIGYEIQLDWKSTIEGTQLWIMQLNKGSVNGAGSKKLRGRNTSISIFILMTDIYVQSVVPSGKPSTILQGYRRTGRTPCTASHYGKAQTVILLNL